MLYIPRELLRNFLNVKSSYSLMSKNNAALYLLKPVKNLSFMPAGGIGGS